MSIAAKIGAVAVFWLAVGLIQTFNWGRGAEKAVVMLLLLVAIPYLIALARKPPAPLPAWLQRAITIAFATCLVLAVAYFIARIIHPHLIDVATTTLAAGTAVLHGGNPYALRIDTGPESAGFTGYKYLPMMIAAYLPLGTAWGARGILATNLILFGGCLWLLKRLGRSMLAPLLFLMLPLVAEQIFAKGATDLAPVILLLAAFAVSERSSFLSGLCVGLSIAAKPAPGVLFIPALVPAEKRWHYAAGIAAGLLPLVPFLWMSPGAMIANIVTFNLSRAPDATSWLFGASAFAARIAEVAMAMLYAYVLVYVWRDPPPLATRAGIGAMLGIAALLSGPGAHHNYQLWWLPFYALLLSLALAPRESCQEPALRYTNATERGIGRT